MINNSPTIILPMDKKTKACNKKCCETKAEGTKKETLEERVKRFYEESKEFYDALAKI